jgi:HAD superfamily hydrolase (TIGR01549 family)
MALKLITIDFWNTLFDSSNGKQRNEMRQHVLLSEIKKFNRTISEVEFNEALKESWNYFNTIWMNELRTPTPYDTVKFFWDYLKLPFDSESIEIIEKVFSESSLNYPPNMNPGVKESLKELSKNYKLGIISDTGFTPGSLLRELLKRFEILEYFSGFSFSDETGVSKPHPKAYTTLLEHYKIKADEALHIGDIERTDIFGAKSLGMKAIKYCGDETSRFKSKEEESQADVILNHWDDILQYIQRL